MELTIVIPGIIFLLSLIGLIAFVFLKIKRKKAEAQTAAPAEPAAAPAAAAAVSGFQNTASSADTSLPNIIEPANFSSSNTMPNTNVAPPATPAQPTGFDNGNPVASTPPPMNNNATGSNNFDTGPSADFSTDNLTTAPAAPAQPMPNTGDVSTPAPDLNSLPGEPSATTASLDSNNFETPGSSQNDIPQLVQEENAPAASEGEDSTLNMIGNPGGAPSADTPQPYNVDTVQPAAPTPTSGSPAQQPSNNFDVSGTAAPAAPSGVSDTPSVEIVEPSPSDAAQSPAADSAMPANEGGFSIDNKAEQEVPDAPPQAAAGMPATEPATDRDVAAPSNLEPTNPNADNSNPGAQPAPVEPQGGTSATPPASGNVPGGQPAPAAPASGQTFDLPPV